ncbi:unnamed protein product [Cochlearia groenlandica]
MNKSRLRALSSPSGSIHYSKGCRMRRRNYEKSQLKRINFSKDEDELILKLHALLGDRWSLVAGRLPGRSENEVKIHWETYLKRKLINMGIDPSNHRLFHHTNYISRQRKFDYSDKEHGNNVVSDHSSSVYDSCDMTTLTISSTYCLEDSTSTGESRLPDLNIGLNPIKTVASSYLPDCYIEDSSESSMYGSTGQKTLHLFR